MNLSIRIPNTTLILLIKDKYKTDMKTTACKNISQFEQTIRRLLTLLFSAILFSKLFKVP